MEGVLASGERDVMMFVGWASYPDYLNVVEASAGRYRVIELNNLKRSDLSGDYNPHAPKVFGGDPAASLEFLKPRMESGKLTFAWETLLERHTWGFRIERSFSCDGPWEPITKWIRAKGSSHQGASYAATDRSYAGGLAYY